MGKVVGFSEDVRRHHFLPFIFIYFFHQFPCFLTELALFKTIEIFALDIRTTKYLDAVAKNAPQSVLISISPA